MSPIDNAIQTERLSVINDVQNALAQIGDLDTASVIQLDEWRTLLDNARQRLLQFSRLGDRMAHALYVNLSDAIIKIDYRLQQTRLLQPKHGSVRVRNNSTLQFIAEDELGSQADWVRLLETNPSVKYSTDLLDREIVTLP